MENSNQEKKQRPTNAQVTKRLIKKAAELKKKNREVIKKLDDLKSKSDQLLHPEDQ